MSASGWILLDKPEGTSSNKAMCKIRSLLRAKTGYVGTLDPFAQGMLPIAVGDARKFIQYVDDSEKEYTFKITFGAETDTLDRCGIVLNTSIDIPDYSDIIDVLPTFVGTIKQKPPAFSAISINGVRAYRIARNSGTSIELPDRTIEVKELEYDGLSFRCVCSRGTYIRSLARDICKALGVFGHVSYLRRERVGFLDSTYSRSIENIEKNVYNGTIDLLPTECALDDILAVTLGDDHVVRLQNGLSRTLDTSFVVGSLYRVFRRSDNVFCGLVRAYDSNKISPVRMCCF